MAHVTGGGLPGNLPRVLPDGCRARISRTAWTPPPVFATLQRAGQLADAEMFRVFNMGIGYVIVLPPKDADLATGVLRDTGESVLRLREGLAGARRGGGVAGRPGRGPPASALPRPAAAPTVQPISTPSAVPA